MLLRPNPKKIRKKLFDSQEDPLALGELCQKHSELIRQHFSDWAKVPDEVRKNPDLVPHYAKGLIAVAQHFAQAGDTSLIERLSPPSNPMQKLEGRLNECRQLLRDHLYDEAIVTCKALLQEASTLTGNWRSWFDAVCNGTLGDGLFQSGKVVESEEAFSAALALCIEAGDFEGVRAYTSSLSEVLRYLGRREDAANIFDVLADIALQANSDATPYRDCAEALRKELPLNRVVVLVDDKQYELGNLPHIAEGSAQFLFERDRLSLGLSDHLVEMGMKVASSGQLQEALKLWAEAAAVDPKNPAPRYQSGLALMELGRYADAIIEYEATELLAPGWYHCRADLALACELNSGALDAEILRALRLLEDGPASVEEKIAVAREMLKENSNVGALWLQLGRLVEDANEAEQALRRGLQCDVDDDTRTRLLVALGVKTTDPSQRTSLLNDAIELNGNLVAAAQARLIVGTH